MNVEEPVIRVEPMNKKALHDAIRQLLKASQLGAGELIANVREVRKEDLEQAKALLDAEQEKIDARRRELGLPITRVRNDKTQEAVKA